VVDCIKPPPALGHPHPQKKEKDNSSPATHGLSKTGLRSPDLKYLIKKVFYKKFNKIYEHIKNHAVERGLTFVY
jgi:hypothetical protein